MNMDEKRVAVDSLDPASWEAGYWGRFQDRVLQAAAPELARRRVSGDRVSWSDVILSWGRMLVPSALVAATVAAILIPPRATSEPLALGVEELLQILVDEPVPALFASDEMPDPVLVRVALEGG